MLIKINEDFHARNEAIVQQRELDESVLMASMKALMEAHSVIVLKAKEIHDTFWKELTAFYHVDPKNGLEVSGIKTEPDTSYLVDKEGSLELEKLAKEKAT